MTTETLPSLRGKIGDRQLAALGAGFDPSQCNPILNRLLAIALDDDRYIAGETMDEAALAIMETCWGDGFDGDRADMVAVFSHIVSEVLRTAEQIQWVTAERYLDGSEEARASIKADWSETGWAGIERRIAALQNQREWTASRLAGETALNKIEH
jgi:hypothetical protein